MSSVAQRSFAAGELAPALHARTDADQYARGLKTLRNFTVMRSGGARNRAGFVALSRSSGATPHIPRMLLEWEQSLLRPLIIEIGTRNSAYYMRFWSNGNSRGARLITGNTSTSWTTATSYAKGAVVFVSTTYYYCKSAHTSGGTTQPGVGGSWTTVWHELENNANGDPIAEIPLPWPLSAAAPPIQWADESPTVRYFVHPEYAMQKLTDNTPQNAANELEFDGVIEDVVFTVTDPVAAPTGMSITGDAGSNAADDTRYFVTAIDGVFEGASSAIVQWSRLPAPFVSSVSPGYSPITVSWSAVSGAEGYNIYRSIQKKKFVLVDTVIGVTSFTDRGAPSGVAQYTAPGDAVRLATFANPDYPEVIAAYQQRLLLSGVPSKRDTIYASRTASFTNFSVRDPILDDDAIQWRQASSRANIVRHMAEVNGRLVIFTDKAEGIASGDTDGILRPGESNPRTLTFNGVAQSPRPLNINTALLYLQASGSTVRDLSVAGEFRSNDLTELSHHLLDGYTITSWCFQKTPDPIIWMVRDDGALLSLTYAPENGVLAWAKHDTVGSFVGVAAVPSIEGYYGDTVYAIVERVNGTFIEMLSPRAVAYNGVGYSGGNPIFLDCATGCGSAVDDPPLSIIFSPSGFVGVVDGGTLEISNLDHLEGEAVAVVGFPAIDAPPPVVLAAATVGGLRTVTGGVISITQDEFDTYGTNMVVGLPIVADLETLDIDTANGRSMKERGMSISRLGAWVEQTRSFFAGPDLPSANAVTDMARITVTDADGIELTETVGDGYVEGNLNGRFNKSGRICIRHVEATPLTVLAVMPQGVIGG